MTEPRPSSNEDDRLHRMLLAYVRQEFEAPVGAILGYAEIMLEDAERHGHHSVVGDLQRLHQAGIKLKELVSGLLDSAATNQDFADFRQNLRHDLRTPISAIKGLSEMLLEDAEVAGNDIFAHDLEKLLEAVGRLLAQIDTLVDFSGVSLPAATGSKPGTVAVSAFLKSVPPLSSAANRKTEPSRILIDDNPSDPTGAGVTAEMIPTCDQFAIQGDLFSRAIREGGEVAVPLEDSVRNMRVIDAIFRSAESGRWEEL